MVDYIFILGGKTFKEIEFPEKWTYDFDMCRWYSDDYTVELERYNENNRIIPIKEKKYIYLTDKKLDECTRTSS